MKNNKKILFVLSCILIAGIVSLYSVREYWNRGEDQTGKEAIDISSLRLVTKNVVHCNNDLSDFFFRDCTVLIVGYSGCEPCDEIKDYMGLPSDINIDVYYIDVMKSGKHKLLSQALRTSGFPTVYLIDQDHTINSILRGTVGLQSKLINSIYSVKGTIEEIIDGIDEEKISGMLSASLKAVLALNSENYKEVRDNAYKSIGYGEYFFNNWLLHTYYTQEHKIDSANYYKVKSLQYVDGVNSMVYDDLIVILSDE